MRVDRLMSEVGWDRDGEDLSLVGNKLVKAMAVLEEGFYSRTVG